MVARLTADRTRTLDEEWKAVTARHLTRYDTAERDAWLAEENRIAEWHREYRAKYELEQRLAVWTAKRANVVILGTRGHTRCLYEYVDGFAGLDVSAFVPMDDQPGEPGELSVYREAVARRHRLDAPSTQCWSRRTSTRRWPSPDSRDVIRPGTDVLAMYDDAGDSLLHVLPERWAVVNPLPTAGGTEIGRSVRLQPDQAFRQHRFRVQHAADPHRRAVRGDRQLSLLSSHGRLAEGHQVDHARGVRRAAPRRSRRTSSARRWAS